MDATVFTAAHRYDIVHDRTLRTRVFVAGAVTDDGDGRAIAPPYRVSVDEPLLEADAHDLGFALSGDPEAALVDTSIPHPLVVGIESRGYRPAALTVTIPANPLFPIAAPVAMRREPVRLTGRVTELASGAGVAGAQLTISGPLLPAPRRAVLLGQPLVADLSGAAAMQGHSIAPVASPVAVKSAQVASAAGSAGILVDDRQALAAGQLLRLGPPERAHWVEIAAVSATPANMALPGMVTLTEPLAGSLRLGDPVAPFALGGTVGPSCTPIDSAFAGEAVVILDDLPSGGLVVISDTGAPDRYAAIGVFSGAGGDYAANGLARLAAPILSVTATGYTSQNRICLLPLGAGAAASADWRLKP